MPLCLWGLLTLTNSPNRAHVVSFINAINTIPVSFIKLLVALSCLPILGVSRQPPACLPYFVSFSSSPFALLATLSTTRIFKVLGVLKDIYDGISSTREPRPTRCILHFCPCNPSVHLANRYAVHYGAACGAEDWLGRLVCTRRTFLLLNLGSVRPCQRYLGKWS
ncbi:hypothetical protein F4802DRAFT_592329 [Xylaria palmicola]|nr:hypothetical protein F4802DRAFT_592329 [Xylaria palmicola]